jgi:ribosomal protein S18 acetylase RimI-like enzyme
MKLRKTNRDEFIRHITADKADKFAKTFVAKTDMQDIWEFCVGCWSGEELMGTIITTVSKRMPHVANLQLLHTFVKHRRKGVARMLTQNSLDLAIANNAEYYRVSSEIEAVPFYHSIGFKFWGRQKSGCLLSIFKVNGNDFADGIYDIDDPIIQAAVYKRGKGGCVEIYTGIA